MGRRSDRPAGDRTRLRPLGWVAALLLLLWLPACQGLVPTPPRVATQAAGGPRSSSPSPVFLAAPTPTGEPPPTPAPAPQADRRPLLTLWVNETSPAHRERLRTMQAEIERDHGLALEVVLIDETRLPDLVAAAVLSGTLPDAILHPLEFTTLWYEEGILDAAAAADVLEQLGRNTFDPSALALVTNADGRPAALPVSADPQVLLYRQDWFDTLNLDPPTSYEAILAAAAAIYRSESLSSQTGISSTLISGLVVPTESDLVPTQQVFEQLALANGCHLVDENGEVQILAPACFDALSFYRELVNGYSPSDVQTEISALNAYLAGRTGMIVTSPATLTTLAGLDSAYLPSCPECAVDPEFLLKNTGLVTAVSGRSPGAGAAGFSNLTYLGFTAGADPELVATFAGYWYNDGYLAWLAVDPARKIPLRGTGDGTSAGYRERWLDLPVTAGGPPLGDMIDRTLLTEMADNAADAPRWGFATGQGALLGEIYHEFVFSILLQEMLSGYFTSDQAALEAYLRVVDLIPDYAYRIDPLPTLAPTPTPEDN